MAREASGGKKNANVESNALVVAAAIKQLKSVGLSDLEIDGIRDSFVETGSEIIKGSDTARIEEHLNENQAKAEAKRSNAFSGIGKTTQEKMAREMRLMGGAVDDIKQFIPTDKWDDSYAVENYAAEKGDPSKGSGWMSDLVPQVIAAFISSSGDLSSDKVTAILSEFDQDTQKIIKQEMASRLQMAQSEYFMATGKPNVSNQDMFADHASIIEQLGADKADQVSSIEDLQYNTKGDLNRMSQAANRKMIEAQRKTATNLRATELDEGILNLESSLSPEMVALIDKLSLEGA